MPRGIPKKRFATKKQITALRLVSQGMPAGKAMIQAGYSKGVARNPKKMLYESEAITTIIDKFHFELKHMGVTTGYLAKKYAEWIDAQKTEFESEVVEGTAGKKIKITKRVNVPDYQTQIQAGKMLNDVYKLKPEAKEDDGLKRRITLEEFITPKEVSELPANDSEQPIEETSGQEPPQTPTQQDISTLIPQE